MTNEQIGYAIGVSLALIFFLWARKIIMHALGRD